MSLIVLCRSIWPCDIRKRGMGTHALDARTRFSYTHGYWHDVRMTRTPLSSGFNQLAVTRLHHLAVGRQCLQISQLQRAPANSGMRAPCGMDSSLIREWFIMILHG